MLTSYQIQALKWKIGLMSKATLLSCKRRSILIPGFISSSVDMNSGDACHPMIPYLAQGANSSIEDGAVIGLLLGRITSKGQLRQALEMYQTMRKARGEAIARESLKHVSM